MKKIISVLLIISFAPLTAQKIVVLAPMEVIYKPVRCSWHCAKIAIAFAQFDTFKRILYNYYLIREGDSERLHAAYRHMLFTSTGGILSLHSGIVGLKEELWDEKNKRAQ